MTVTTSGKSVLQYLLTLSDENTAQQLKRFFKTAKGEYGEGDIFIGVRVPVLRKIAKQHKLSNLTELEPLLTAKYHEARLLGLLYLVQLYQSTDLATRQIIFDWYINNSKFINNWDLVDASADKIVGHFLFKRDKQILYTFAASDGLWQKRIAVMATFYFIKQHEFFDALQIVELLLHDKHDLIHKACGWMLREIGNRHLPTEENFLKRNYNKMPRTMLRYAIEKFTESKRQKYLKGLA